MRLNICCTGEYRFKNIMFPRIFLLFQLKNTFTRLCLPPNKLPVHQRSYSKVLLSIKPNRCLISLHVTKHPDPSGVIRDRFTHCSQDQDQILVYLLPTCGTSFLNTRGAVESQNTAVYAHDQFRTGHFLSLTLFSSFLESFLENFYSLNACFWCVSLPLLSTRSCLVSELLYQ